MIAREAPITFELAARRVGQAYELGRMTDRVLDRLFHLVSAAGSPRLLPMSRDGVFWKSGQEPARWREFRIPTDLDESRRDAADIPTVEVANAAECVLRQEISMSTEALAREVARIFGIRRLGDAVRSRMEGGVMALAARGGCELDGDSVRLPR